MKRISTQTTSFYRMFLPLVLIVFLSATSTVFSQCPVLVWSDEFDGTTLDLNKWTPQIGDGCDIGLCGWGNNELQYYTDRPENLKVENGNLIITARKERVKAKNYTSARIRSRLKGDWKYGRFEARMKLPTGKGMWPAFWMLSTDEVYGGWPQSGEIDIMEQVGHESEIIHGTLHYGEPYPNNSFTGNKFAKPYGTFNDGFHVVAIEWEPNVIRWYVDGILYSTKTNTDLAPHRWPFDQRFHFLLNLAVGGNWPGSPDANTVFPQTYEIDYVRVYAGGFNNITGPHLVLKNQKAVEFSVAQQNGTTYQWSVPAGATIISGNGTNKISVDWGTADGNVNVVLNSSCGAVNVNKRIYLKKEMFYEFSFENFEDQRHLTFSSTTGTLEQAIANPNPAGVNTSSHVGKYIRNSTQQYDLLVYKVSKISDANLYSSNKKKFYMDVYSDAPVNTPIYIQLENSSQASSSNFPTGRHSRYIAYTSKQNSWEKLEFVLDSKLDTSVPSDAVDQLIFLFNSNSFTGNTYYFDNFDSYSVEGTVADTEAPTTPANLQVTGKTDKSVSLAWNASTDNVGVTEYLIYQGTTLAGSTSQTLFTVSNLIPETNYSFNVTAKDAAGNQSALSNTVNITTDPAPTTSVLKIEAEHYVNMKGVTTVTCLDEGGGLNVASIDSRDFMDYNVSIPTSGTYLISYRVASNTGTGKFDLRIGRSTLSSLSVPNTGGNQVWQTISSQVNLSAGTYTFRIAATASGFNLNWLSFEMKSSTQAFLKTDYTAEQVNFKIYPNPAHQKLMVIYNQEFGKSELSLYSLEGRKIISFQNFSGGEVELPNLNKGIYYVELKTESSILYKKLKIE